VRHDLEVVDQRLHRRLAPLPSAAHVLVVAQAVLAALADLADLLDRLIGDASWTANLATRTMVAS
jgi:hypothetical protein